MLAMLKRGVQNFEKLGKMSMIKEKVRPQTQNCRRNKHFFWNAGSGFQKYTT